MSEITSLFTQNTHSGALSSIEVGQIGEKLAAKFLERNDYRLVLANFKVPVGRNNRGAVVTGEIDLIALDADVLCFVEVKTRSSDDFAAPLAAITLRKQRQIIRAAKVYRKIFQLGKIRFRYDAVSVLLIKNERPNIELHKNYWTEEKFRKKIWHELKETIY